jgi:hypothetical protein
MAGASDFPAEPSLSGHQTLTKRYAVEKNCFAPVAFNQPAASP